jgi:tetratricopeptide (TPR) repeat protein
VALIVGIDVYNNIEMLDPLPSCKKDGEDLYRLLSDLGYTIKKNAPLIGSKLDKTEAWVQIREAIGDFFLDAKPSQTLLFYFSGHGIPRGDEVYLGTPQIDPKKPSIKGISLSELANNMNSSNSRQVVSIVDACYSGAAKLGGSKSTRKDSSASIAAAAYDRVWKRVPRAEGKYFLLSSQSYEKSWITEQNSLYTKYIIEGLRGVKVKVDENGREIQYSGSVDNNGNVTPESLHDYVYNKVASYSISEETEQVPKIKVDKSSKTILAEYPKLAMPQLQTDSTWFMKEGNKYLAKHDYANAIISFSMALEKKENHVDAYAKKGYALSYLKRYDEAIECFDKAIEIDPNYADAWLGKHNEAIHYYDKAIEISPKYKSAWHGKAFALVNLGKHDEAIECFDKLISINPADDLACHGMGYTINDSWLMTNA